MNLDSIKKYDLATISADLKDFCHLSNQNDLIQISEWHNGEGFDILIIKNNGEKVFALTHGELDAIIVLTKML